ncbi:MAG: transcriptional regulator [Firmicutes bacterium]|nr:transcriptional regulator [Bacillota bacterium]MBO2520853.1 transcriptional regulator [Bacillota bacterium]
MDLMRIGSKLISRTRLIRRLDEILQMRVAGKSQQETAEALGVDRTFISRLEALGEVRKGGKVALIGFPIENKRELEEAARAEGVDFVLLFTEEERWRFAEGMSGAELINEIMRIGAELRSYDAVILLGSDMRIGLMESLIGKENVIGIEIGRSPIRRDVRVEVDRIVELLRALKV